MKSFWGRPAQMLLLPVLLVVSRSAARAEEPLDTGRIREIAAMLPEHAAGSGQPSSNRAAWEALAASHPEATDVIANAARRAAQPLPEQPDSLFLEFSQNGDRERWQNVAYNRRIRVQVFALAECLENKGRFLAPLEQTIAALCAERTWVLPAHDGELKNFRGETIEIDLGSAGLGVELATTSYLLGDRLSEATRKLIRENLERRIFAPYRAAVNGTSKEFWWMRAGNNWNAVCLNDVTGTALQTLDSAEERAWFIAAAEKLIGHYLAGGFTPDGYCVEGLGYWNYGFTKFALLAENVRQATGGKVDLLSRPQAVQPALFGLRADILGGVCITIADSDPGDEPSGILMSYLYRRFGSNFARWRDAKLAGTLYEQATWGFLPADIPQIRSEENLGEVPWRSWFPDGGVLICRPGTVAKVPFAVAIKGGNNGVNHGHTDVGSFSVVAGKAMVICDPGGEVYTARTFSAHRFDSKVLNSFGHAVPVIAGQLQRAGAEARGVVLAHIFTDAADTLTLDYRSAYPVADLKKLNRTFVFSRGDSPSLEVRDEIQFASPETFESALITWGTIRKVSANELEIADGADAVRVAIDTQGRAFELKQETIDENVDSKRKPVRLGIALTPKISTATVTLRISPVIK
ncbi:MAG: hypothetical protein ACLQVA_15345 [Candidatus Brocadiia bacterium]